MAGFTTNDPERHAADLKRRFRRVSRKAAPWSSRLSRPGIPNPAIPKPGIPKLDIPRLGTKALAVVALLCLAAGLAFQDSRVRGWDFTTYLLHIAAAPNCAHARAVDLAPARRNEPGYYARHDRDNDGLSCEDSP